jgi:lipopolysaccharide export LptBFGC system permease protein LptF
MKLIDRYIIRQFLVTALFSLAAVLVIFIIIDAMKLDDLSTSKPDGHHRVTILLHAGDHC